MASVTQDGITFTVEEAGAGEPVVFIHGALVSDAFRPLISAGELTSSYRMVAYRRRGYEGSSSVPAAFSIREQAQDCLRLMQHHGLQRAHVVGHSFGGAVALQLAIDMPEAVLSLALLEPALMVGESGEGYRQSLQDGIAMFRARGPRGAVETMLSARWPNYSNEFEPILPGAFEQAVRDAETSFECELPSLFEWRFGSTEAAAIKQPILSVMGELSPDLSPRFAEVHQWLQDEMAAEPYVLPRAHHFLQLENETDMVAALKAFWSRHPSKTKL